VTPARGERKSRLRGRSYHLGGLSELQSRQCLGCQTYIAWLVQPLVLRNRGHPMQGIGVAQTRPELSRRPMTVGRLFFFSTGGRRPPLQFAGAQVPEGRCELGQRSHHGNPDNQRHLRCGQAPQTSALPTFRQLPGRAAPAESDQPKPAHKLRARGCAAGYLLRDNP
jgi:hypothetical protein